jgi:uncharacterized phage-associated protein
MEKGEREMTVAEFSRLAEIFDVPMEILMDSDLSVREKVEESGASKRSWCKFQNLVRQCIKYGADNDGKITKTKLAKLVYLADFASYYHRLRPISGFRYHRLEQGPVAIEFFDLIDNDESVSIERKDKAQLVSIVEQPDDTVLDKEELALVKKICAKWKGKSTQEIVEFTHRQVPWQICREREVIPYSLINNEEAENVY